MSTTPPTLDNAPTEKATKDDNTLDIIMEAAINDLTSLLDKLQDDESRNSFYARVSQSPSPETKDILRTFNRFKTLYRETFMIASSGSNTKVDDLKQQVSQKRAGEIIVAFRKIIKSDGIQIRLPLLWNLGEIAKECRDIWRHIIRNSSIPQITHESLETKINDAEDNNNLLDNDDIPISELFADITCKKATNEVNASKKQKRAPPTKGPCEHGKKNRSSCKVCIACPHGKRPNLCKECDGSAICLHGRQRFRCKECGGGGICEHGRDRYACKKCSASKKCVHGRYRSRCEECRETLSSKSAPEAHDNTSKDPPVPNSEGHDDTASEGHDDTASESDAEVLCQPVVDTLTPHEKDPSSVGVVKEIRYQHINHQMVEVKDLNENARRGTVMIQPPTVSHNPLNKTNNDTRRVRSLNDIYDDPRSDTDQETSSKTHFKIPKQTAVVFATDPRQKRNAHVTTAIIDPPQENYEYYLMRLDPNNGIGHCGRARENHCAICDFNNHTTADCTRQCKNCGSSSHTTARCNRPIVCAICIKPGHTADLCSVITRGNNDDRQPGDNNYQTESNDLDNRRRDYRHRDDTRYYYSRHRDDTRDYRHRGDSDRRRHDRDRARWSRGRQQ